MPTLKTKLINNNNAFIFLNVLNAFNCYYCCFFPLNYILFMIYFIFHEDQLKGIFKKKIRLLILILNKKKKKYTILVHRNDLNYG